MKASTPSPSALEKRILGVAEEYISQQDQRQERRWTLDADFSGDIRLQVVPNPTAPARINASRLLQATKGVFGSNSGGSATSRTAEEEAAQQKTLTTGLIKRLAKDFSSEICIGVSYSRGGIISIRRKNIDDYPSTSFVVTCCIISAAFIAAGLVASTIWYIVLSMKV